MQAIGLASRRVEETTLIQADGELVSVDIWMVFAKWAAIGLGGVVCWSWYVALITHIISLLPGRLMMLNPRMFLIPCGLDSLVAFKIILGINLLNFASRRHAGMEERKLDDDGLNSFARPPLGEGPSEKVSSCIPYSQPGSSVPSVC